MIFEEKYKRALVIKRYRRRVSKMGNEKRASLRVHPAPSLWRLDVRQSYVFPKYIKR